MNTLVEYRFVVRLQVPFYFIELITILCNVPHSLAAIALDHKDSEITVLLVHLVTYLMIHFKGCIRDLQGHLEKIFSFQDEDLREVPCLDSWLSDYLREKTNLSKVLILRQVCHMGLRMLINNGHFPADNEKYLGALFTLNDTVIIDSVNSLLQNEAQIAEKLNREASEHIYCLEDSPIKVDNYFPS